MNNWVKTATSVSFDVKGEDLLRVIKKLVRKANVFRITVMRGNRTIASIPVTYGAVFFTLFPFLSLITSLSLVARDYRLVVEKR